MKLHQVFEARYINDAGDVFNTSMKNVDKRGLYIFLIGLIDSGKRTFEEIVDRFDHYTHKYNIHFTTIEKNVFLQVLQYNAKNKRTGILWTNADFKN